MDRAPWRKKERDISTTRDREIYQALWFFKYWNKVPEKGSITNIFPLRSFIFSMVSSSIMLGLKWLVSSNYAQASSAFTDAVICAMLSLTWKTPFSFSTCHEACSAWGCKTKMDIFFVEFIFNDGNEIRTDDAKKIFPLSLSLALSICSSLNHRVFVSRWFYWFKSKRVKKREIFKSINRTSSNTAQWSPRLTFFLLAFFWRRFILLLRNCVLQSTYK